MNDDTVSVWNKKGDELTVAESLKISGAVMLVTMGITVLVAATPVIWEKISQKRQARKDKKALEHLEV